MRLNRELYWLNAVDGPPTPSETDTLVLRMACRKSIFTQTWGEPITLEFMRTYRAQSAYPSKYKPQRLPSFKNSCQRAHFDRTRRLRLQLPLRRFLGRRLDSVVKAHATEVRIISTSRCFCVTLNPWPEVLFEKQVFRCFADILHTAFSDWADRQIGRRFCLMLSVFAQR